MGDLPVYAALDIGNYSVKAAILADDAVTIGSIGTDGREALSNAAFNDLAFVFGKAAQPFAVRSSEAFFENLPLICMSSFEELARNPLFRRHCRNFGCLVGRPPGSSGKEEGPHRQFSAYYKVPEDSKLASECDCMLEAGCLAMENVLGCFVDFIVAELRKTYGSALKGLFLSYSGDASMQAIRMLRKCASLHSQIPVINMYSQHICAASAYRMAALSSLACTHRLTIVSIGQVSSFVAVFNVSRSEIKTQAVAYSTFGAASFDAIILDIIEAKAKKLPLYKETPGPRMDALLRRAAEQLRKDLLNSDDASYELADGDTLEVSFEDEFQPRCADVLTSLERFIASSLSDASGPSTQEGQDCVAEIIGGLSFCSLVRSAATAALEKTQKGVCMTHRLNEIACVSVGCGYLGLEYLISDGSLALCEHGDFKVTDRLVHPVSVEAVAKLGKRTKVFETLYDVPQRRSLKKVADGSLKLLSIMQTIGSALYEEVRCPVSEVLRLLPDQVVVEPLNGEAGQRHSSYDNREEETDFRKLREFIQTFTSKIDERTGSMTDCYVLLNAIDFLLKQCRSHPDVGALQPDMQATLARCQAMQRTAHSSVEELMRGRNELWLVYASLTIDHLHARDGCTTPVHDEQKTTRYHGSPCSPIV